MRSRLSRRSAALVTISIAVVTVTMAPANGAPPPPGGVSGSGSEAVGSLLGGGSGAGIGASHGQFSPGTPVDDAPRGSGGGDDGVTCEMLIVNAGGRADQGATLDQLQRELGTVQGLGQDKLTVEYVCRGPGGQVWYDLMEWPPDGDDAVFIDPAILADMAYESLYFPPPSGSTTPPMDPGTVAQLPTFFQVDNWAPVSESATAGPVTATVTATPVQQTWDIRDSVRDTSYTVSCEGPGVAFDPASGDPPPDGVCEWTPPHSSAGQSVRSEQSNEPCFDATVTITWAVAWESNVGEGDSLGEGTSSSSACLVVGEVQAVVTEGS
jgi:hypothetical protein